ncbi:MAG: glycosyltransferase family 2 protein [Bacillota bacterium]|nr:glycosyltransferase family 2 protein [Bacillota bacterium]
MLSLVIPMYNEEKRIADTIEKCIEKSREVKGGLEIIIVNDGSTDQSLSVAQKYSGFNTTVLSYNKNQGKGQAVKTGVLAAKGDLIAYTDADLAYGLGMLSDALELYYKSKADIVIGNRHIHPESLKKYTPIRRAASLTFSFMLRRVLGLGFDDSQCGFKLFSAEAAKKIFSEVTVKGYAFDFEVLMIAERMGYKIEEIAAVILNHGTSSVHVVRDSYRILRDAASVRRSVERRFPAKGGSDI